MSSNSLLSSSSLRDILAGSKIKKKKLPRAESSSSILKDTDKIVRSIILEETGSFNLRPLKSHKSLTNKSHIKNNKFGSSNYELAKLYRASKFSMAVLASDFGLQSDDASYIENQFRQFHNIISTSKNKILQGIEELGLSGENLEFKNSLLLARFSGIEINDDEMASICKRAIVSIDKEDTFGEIHIDTFNDYDIFFNFEKWLNCILSYHKLYLIKGIIAEKYGKSPQSFLVSKMVPEFGSIFDLDMVGFNDDMALESPSVAHTYNSNDLFNDFNLSFRDSDINTHILHSKSSNVIGSLLKSTASQLTLPRIKSQNSLMIKPKNNSKPRLVKSSGKKTSNNSSAVKGFDLLENLRRELQDAKAGLAELDDMVDYNIAWVQINCDTSSLSKISNTGKEKCRKIALERLFSIFQASLFKSLYKAWDHWQSITFSEKSLVIAQKFLKIKSIEIFTRVIGEFIAKRLYSFWGNWLEKYNNQKYWERDIAAVEIQRVARGMISRFNIKDNSIKKAIIVIQCMFRMKLARKRVAKFKRLKAIAQKKLLKQQKMLKRKQQIQNNKSSTLALPNIKIPNNAKDKTISANYAQKGIRPQKRTIIHNSVIKIQKLHRGNMGRKKFMEKKRNYSATLIQTIIRIKLARRRVSKLKESKNKSHGSFFGRILNPFGSSMEKAKNAASIRSSSNSPSSISEHPQKTGTGILSNISLPSFGFMKSSSPINEEKTTDAKKVDLGTHKDGSNVLFQPIIETSEKIEEKNKDKDKIALKSDVTDHKTKDLSKSTGKTKKAAESPRSDSNNETINTHRSKSKTPDNEGKEQNKNRPGSKQETPKNKVSNTGKTSPARSVSDNSKTSKSPDLSNKITQEENNQSIKQLLKEAEDIKSKADKEAAAAISKADTEANELRSKIEKEAEEAKIKAQNDAASLKLLAEREAAEIKAKAEKEAYDARLKAQKELNDLKLSAEKEIAELRLKADREAEEAKVKLAEALEKLNLENKMQQTSNTRSNTESFVEDKSKTNINKNNKEVDGVDDDSAPRPLSRGFGSFLKKTNSILSPQESESTKKSKKNLDPGPPVIDRGENVKENEGSSKSGSPTGRLSRMESFLGGSPEDSNKPSSPSGKLSRLGSFFGNPPDDSNKPSSPPGKISRIGSYLSSPPVDPNKASTSSSSPTANESNKPSSSSSAFSRVGNFLGNLRPGSKNDKSRPNSKASKKPFIEPNCTKDEAIIRLKRFMRCNLARKKLNKRRDLEMTAQAKAGKLVLWACISIQTRIARGPIGRKRFHQFREAKKIEFEQKRIKSATKIQSLARAVKARVRVKVLRKEKLEAQKLADLAKYRKTGKAPINSSSKPSNGGEYNGLNEEQAKEIQEKLERLEEIEKSIAEKEKRMNEATRIAEERAVAMERALKEFEERARAEEADRLVRQQMLDLAAGPIASSRSNMSSSGPMNRSSRVSSTTPRSKRDNQDAPPTARSARDLAGIPPDAPKIKFEGQTWVQLWDPEESAYYWYCPKNKKAQWEKPGEVYESSSGYESSGALTDYSTDWYDSGGDNTDSEYGGDNWQEFYDDSAQAKYWYNSVTGEATWTQPQQPKSRSSSRLSAREVPAGAYNSPDEWVSYVDPETQQEYWYNSKTGETSWTR